jgi:hypothetical protein
LPEFKLSSGGILPDGDIISYVNFLFFIVGVPYVSSLKSSLAAVVEFDGGVLLYGFLEIYSVVG